MLREMKEMRPSQLIQLPNGDLWRGRQDDGIANERPDTLDATIPATPEDAVLEMFASQKGEVITCNWCGEQFNRKQFNEIKEHVEILHPSALKPLKDIEAALAFSMDKAVIVGAIEQIALGS